MAEITINRRVTYEQLEHLWEFLNANIGLAKGYNKTAQGRDFSKRMWENVSNDLNSHGNGAVKDGKGWCKYWNDYKSKLKKLASAARNSYQQTGGGTSGRNNMTEIEKKFIQMLGNDFGCGIPAIRVEPFPIGTAVNNIEVVEMACDTMIVNMDSSRTPTLELDEGSESLLTPSFNIMNYAQPGPSLRTTAQPYLPPAATSRPSIPTPSATPINNFTRQQTPHRSPRRRGRRLPRREPLTQEMARRTLIQISERKLAIEERNSQTLIGIQASLVEIKDMLGSRSREHPRDDK